MTATNFFRACRDLVRVRWRAQISSFGGIEVYRIEDAVCEVEKPYTPIVAVALDVLGKATYERPVIARAARALELRAETARLIHQASLPWDTIGFLNPTASARIGDVKGELVSVLSKNRYPPESIPPKEFRSEEFLPPRARRRWFRERLDQ